MTTHNFPQPHYANVIAMFPPHSHLSSADGELGLAAITVRGLLVLLPPPLLLSGRDDLQRLVLPAQLL